jgi:hypothetical protein
MNRHGTVEIEETTGLEPHLPNVVLESMTPIRDGPGQAGRVREPGCEAAFSPVNQSSYVIARSRPSASRSRVQIENGFAPVACLRLGLDHLVRLRFS